MLCVSVVSLFFLVFRLDRLGGIWRKRHDAGFGQGLHIGNRDEGFILILIFDDTEQPAVFI